MLNTSLTNTINCLPVTQQRRKCVICNYQIPESHSLPDATNVFCNVRAFQQQSFTFWRCPDCQTIHCAEVVDLDLYYSKYPVAGASLNFALRLCYQNLLRHLTSNGFTRQHTLLDYGCGVNGLFVQYLKSQGFTNCDGYEPYADSTGLGNSQIFQKQFDYILLQDVIEHVEAPQQFLADLDQLLKPGGYIFIGTPNASNIALQQPHQTPYHNALHPPYHLHLYTPEVLTQLGTAQGWQVSQFFDRGFDDTHWFGLNTRAWHLYQSLCDGTINAAFEAIEVATALRSPRFWWYAMFGYWLSLKVDMAILFHKPKTD